jgi:hypothetical protein
MLKKCIINKRGHKTISVFSWLLAQAFALNDLAMPPPGVPVLQRFHFYI